MVAQTNRKELNLEYEGSVKRLWTKPGSNNNLYFEFSDNYSIFDWGKMPDTIKNKGLSLTIMGAYFFEKLSKPDFWTNLKNSKNLSLLDKEWLEKRFKSKVFKSLETTGLKHHYNGLFDGEKQISLHSIENADKIDSIYLDVLKADVFHPKKVNMDSLGLYFYPNNASSKRGISLIPLEVVFRFGMPQGSSLKERLKTNPNYFAQLGLKAAPKEGELFDRPVIEFFTKLEATDRYLTWQEAIELSKLEFPAFESLVEHTYAISLALCEMFGHHNITLFDGKFEFIQVLDEVGNPQVYLADSIGPDELRLIYKGHHLSKELVRQYYQASDWALALAKAKAKSKLDPGVEFKTRCIDEFNQSPKPIEAKHKKLIDMLYPAITNTICEKKYFENTLTLDELVDSFNSVFNQSSNSEANAS